MSIGRSVVVIGVGNAARGDDAAGLEVVGRLADLGQLPGVEVRAHEGEGVGLIELWRDADAVVLIDAARSGAPAGTVHRFDAAASPVAVPLRSTSSHAVGVVEAIELARVLGRLPRSVVVYGIEGAAYELGRPLSESVAPMIAVVADAVRCELRR